MSNPIMTWCLAVRNAAERLPIVMKAIRERTPNAEVVIVDNCSGDNTVDNRIRQIIGTMPKMPEAPPKDMPQPVIVRIGATPGFG